MSRIDDLLEALANHAPQPGEVEDVVSRAEAALAREPSPAARALRGRTTLAASCAAVAVAIGIGAGNLYDEPAFAVADTSPLTPSYALSANALLSNEPPR